jgi:hypothetical protein
MTTTDSRPYISICYHIYYFYWRCSNQQLQTNRSKISTPSTIRVIRHQPDPRRRPKIAALARCGPPIRRVTPRINERSGEGEVHKPWPCARRRGRTLSGAPRPACTPATARSRLPGMPGASPLPPAPPVFASSTRATPSKVRCPKSRRRRRRREATSCGYDRWCRNGKWSGPRDRCGPGVWGAPGEERQMATWVLR